MGRFLGLLLTTNGERCSTGSLPCWVLFSLPFRSVWVLGGDFNAEVGYRGVGEDSTLGVHAHGRRTRAAHQLVEWALGEDYQTGLQRHLVSPKELHRPPH